MKQLLLFFSLLTVGWSGYGQLAIPKSTLDAGGKVVINGNKMILFTVGETCMGERQSNNKKLSEGFITPKILGSLGIHTEKKLSGVNVYPVPAHNRLNIIMAKSGNYEIYLYDLSGKILVKQNLKEATNLKLDLSPFKAGNYLLVVIQLPQKRYYIQKIVKH